MLLPVERGSWQKGFVRRGKYDGDDVWWWVGYAKRAVGKGAVQRGADRRDDEGKYTDINRQKR